MKNEVSATRFRLRFHEIMKKVEEDGEEFTIMLYRKPVAVLKPCNCVVACPPDGVADMLDEDEAGE